MSPCPGISLHSWVIWPPPSALIQECGGRLFSAFDLLYIYDFPWTQKLCVQVFYSSPPPPHEDCFLLYFSHQKRHGPTISSQRLKKHDIFLFLLFMLLLQQRADPAKCVSGTMALPWPLPGNSKVPVGSGRSWSWALPLSLSHLSIRSLKAVLSYEGSELKGCFLTSFGNDCIDLVASELQLEISLYESPHQTPQSLSRLWKQTALCFVCDRSLYTHENARSPMYGTSVDKSFVWAHIWAWFT